MDDDDGGGVDYDGDNDAHDDQANVDPHIQAEKANCEIKLKRVEGKISNSRRSVDSVVGILMV